MVIKASPPPVLDSDSVFKIGHYLRALAGRQSEEIFKRLSEVRPDLPHRMRVAEGGDYSDVRLRIKSNFYWNRPYVDPELYTIPSVSLSLLSYYQNYIAEGHFDKEIHTHFARAGFDFEAKGLIDYNFEDFTPNDKMQLLLWVRSRALVSITQGLMDQTLLNSPDQLLRAVSDVDQPLVNEAKARLYHLLQEAIQKATEPVAHSDEASTQVTQLKYKLAKNPLLLESLTNQPTIVVLNALKDLPANGRNELYLLRSSPDRFQWRLFDCGGVTHDYHCFKADPELGYYLHFLEQNEQFPAFGQNSIYVKKDAAGHYQLKIFDELFQPRSKIYTRLSYALTASITEVKTQLEQCEQAQGRKRLCQALAIRICQDYGTGPQRDLVENLFATQDSIKKTEADTEKKAKLLHALIGDDYSLKHLAYDYTRALLKANDGFLKRHLPFKTYSHHPQADIRLHSMANLKALILEGQFDFEFSFVRGSTGYGNQEDLKIKEVLLDHSNRLISSASIERVATLIRSGRWDQRLFSTDHNYGDRLNAFQKVIL